MDLMDWNRMLPVKTQIQVQNFGDQIDTTNIRIKHDATAPGNATTNIAKIDPETRSSQGEKSVQGPTHGICWISLKMMISPDIVPTNPKNGREMRLKFKKDLDIPIYASENRAR